MIQITLSPDMSIEPGRQWIVLPMNAEGMALSDILAGGETDVKFERSERGFEIFIPHTKAVDERIVALIDALAYVRYQAPDLVQMTLMEEHGS